MRSSIAFLLALGFGALTGVGDATAAGLEGNWSGGGIAHLSNGKKEALRCRINYNQNSSRAYGYYAVCSHSGGTFKQSGTVVGSGNRFSGRAYNALYNTTGRFIISLRGNSQTVSMSSKKGSARISLRRR